MKNKEKQIEPPTEGEILDIFRSYNPDAFEFPEPNYHTRNAVDTIERKSNTSFFIRVACTFYYYEPHESEENTDVEVEDDVHYFDMLYEYINGKWEIQSYDVN